MFCIYECFFIVQLLCKFESTCNYEFRSIKGEPKVADKTPCQLSFPSNHVGCEVFSNKSPTEIVPSSRVRGSCIMTVVEDVTLLLTEVTEISSDFGCVLFCYDYIIM